MSHIPPPSPPPLPPKSPSVRTTATHSSTNLSESDTHTVSTHYHHSPARPTHAQKGVRHQASFHTINQLLPPQSTPAQATATGSSQAQTRPPTGTMLDTAAIISTATYGEGGASGTVAGGVGLGRAPSLSFLTSDPNRAPTPSTSSHGTFSTLSRQSSLASIGIHSQPQPQQQGHAQPQLPAPSSSTWPNTSPMTPNPYHQHRLSALTTRSGRSGMADIDPTSPLPHSSPGSYATNVTYPSAMAVHSHPSSPAQTPVPPTPRVSSSFRRARSTKSTKSNKSITPTPTTSGSITSKNRKRASNSTIHRRSFQRKYGKWEVDEMNNPLIHGDGRRGEEELELEALLGRATVLERMLRAGKRVCPIFNLQPSTSSLPHEFLLPPNRAPSS